jgi:hypothetical protein
MLKVSNPCGANMNALTLRQTESQLPREGNDVKRNECALLLRKMMGVVHVFAEGIKPG